MVGSSELDAEKSIASSIKNLCVESKLDVTCVFSGTIKE